METEDCPKLNPFLNNTFFMKFLFIAGIIFFFGSIILVKSNYEKFDIERYGQIVKMRIENLPKSCIGVKVGYFVTYSYKNKMYDK